MPINNWLNAPTSMVISVSPSIVSEIFLTDADMFHMFSRAEAWIRAFEREQTGRKQRKENFGSLYRLLNKELEGHFAGLYQRFEEMGLLEPDEKAA